MHSRNYEAEQGNAILPSNNHTLKHVVRNAMIRLVCIGGTGPSWLLAPGLSHQRVSAAWPEAQTRCGPRRDETRYIIMLKPT